MASKVPKFGAWEGGDNFTVYFDNARKTKNNGPRINPNDPEENPDMFRPRPGPTQTPTQTQTQAPPTPPNRPDNQRKQTKVPHFGAWENEESAGYTVCFENVRKAKNGRPLVTDNEPQMNRDVPRRPDPRAHAQTPVQTRPQGQGQAQAPVQAQGQGQGQGQAQAKARVPQFGDWEREGGGGQGNYTVAFDNLKKKNGPKSNVPQSNRDMEPAPQVGRAKVPEFGAWDGGEAVQYTAYFDNAKKNKNLRPGMNSNEPQMNRDVADRGRAQPVAVAKVESKDDVPRNANRGSAHPNANLQPRGNTGGGRGNPAGSIPQFGGWANDPSQADGYTGAFARAKDDRNTPVHINNVPRPHNPQVLYNNNQKQPSCCTIL